MVDKSGTVKVVAEPDDAEGLPVPGEGVEVHVELEQLNDVITIPAEALVFGASEKAAVFVIDALRVGENLARARRVDVIVAGRSDDLV